MDKKHFKTYLILFSLFFSAFVIDACMSPVDIQGFVGAVYSGNEIIITDDDELKTAIAQQEDGQKWLIKNRTYNVQLDIHTSITVRGESRDGVIIAGPDNYLDKTKLKGVKSGNMFTGKKPPELFGLISIEGVGGEGVKIKDLTVQGVYKLSGDFIDKAQKDGDSADYLWSLCGISVVDAEVTLENLVVERFRDIEAKGGGRYSGWGIVATGGTGAAALSKNKSLTVSGCTVRDFQRHGVSVLEGVKMVTFKGNKVIGMGATICGPSTIENVTVSSETFFYTDYYPTGTQITKWESFLPGSAPYAWPTNWYVAQNGLMLMNCPKAIIEDNIFMDMINASGFSPLVTANTASAPHWMSIGLSCYWPGLTAVPSEADCIIRNNLFINCERGIDIDIKSTLNASTLVTQYETNSNNTFTGAPIYVYVYVNNKYP
jgi:hypothetical protein